jgi:DNA-binding MarR family transcriptional regulator
MRYEEDLPAPLERWRHQVAQPDAFLLLNFLGELSRRVTAAYGTWLRPHGVDFSEYVVLWALRLWEPELPAVSELRARVVMSSGGIALAIDRLDRKGLVRRKPSPSDGRAVLVQLTADGRRLIDELMALDLDRHEGVLDGLTAEQRGAVLDGLAELLGRYPERLEPPAPSSTS